MLAGIAAREVAGYRGAYLARRELGDETEFATILLFDSTESVRAFAGGDYEIAYVPRQAREVLARFDERSLHFEILLTPEETRYGVPANRTAKPRRRRRTWNGDRFPARSET